MATIQDNDIWYVRLPDGRVIRSRSTVSLRYHVRKGRIPLTSRVRRSDKEDWRTLPEVHELAESAAVATARSHRGNARANPDGRVRSRVAFQESRLLGVRGLVRELLDALDSSLSRVKLGVACLLGMLAGVGWISWKLLDDAFAGTSWMIAASVWAIVLLLAVCLGITFITKYTALELSKMRQPRSSELWSGMASQTLRLAATLVIVVGAGVALIWLLRELPAWMLRQHEAAWWGHAASATLIVRLILEVVFWPVIALAPLLLGPILIVEQGSFWAAIRDWWRLLRQHLGRIFLYEALATTLAAVFTVPLLIPIAVASWPLGDLPGQQQQIVENAVIVLGGIALTPLIAYLVVANVFIYLNLRYEFFHSAR